MIVLLSWSEMYRFLNMRHSLVEDWTYVNLVFVERAWIVIWNEASAYVRTWKEIAERKYTQ